jgi:hypothetical protein
MIEYHDSVTNSMSQELLTSAPPHGTHDVVCKPLPFQRAGSQPTDRAASKIDRWGLVNSDPRGSSDLYIFLETQHSSAWETEFHSVFGTAFRKVQINQSDEMTRKSITPELVHTLASQLDGTTLVTPDSAEYGTSIARWSDTAVQNAVYCQSTHAIGSITDQRDGRAQWHFLTQQKLCRNWSSSRQNMAWKLQSKERGPFHWRHQRYDRRARYRSLQDASGHGGSRDEDHRRTGWRPLV